MELRERGDRALGLGSGRGDDDVDAAGGELDLGDGPGTADGQFAIRRSSLPLIVEASTTTARLRYQAIEQILWPLAVPPAEHEWRTVADFRRHALKLYDPGDARRYHRERRFSTLELMTW